MSEFISRKAVLDVLLEEEKKYDPVEQFELTDAIGVLFERIRSLPTEEKQPKKGEWIERENASGDLYYDCSVCGKSWVLNDGTPKENGMNYCPCCGADMRKDGDSDASMA